MKVQSIFDNQPQFIGNVALVCLDDDKIVIN